MTEPVKYVTFGGAQVPEGTKREVIDRNGQKIYCVWTDDKGGKVSYPQQSPPETKNTLAYSVVKAKRDIFDGHVKISQKNISRFEFEDYYNRKNDKYGVYIKTNTANGTRKVSHFYFDGIRSSIEESFTESQLNKTPRLEISTEKGVIFDTQNVTLSNMRSATVTGSTDEDNITLMNSSNCTVDVSNANNNMFVSDNVTVLNGQGNKVKAGDHDQVTFGTHDYETNTDTTKANHEGEGTYRQ